MEKAVTFEQTSLVDKMAAKNPWAVAHGAFTSSYLDMHTEIKYLVKICVCIYILQKLGA